MNPVWTQFLTKGGRMFNEIRLTHSKAKIPTKSEQAFGWDFYCVTGLEGLSDKELEDYPDSWVESWKNSFDIGGYLILPGTGVIIRTGIKVAMEPGFGCLFQDRSSLAAKQQLIKTAGVIDSDYRGEWLVSLMNLSDDSRFIREGDRVVQGTFFPTLSVNWRQVEKLDTTIRGVSGFGSTGK